MKPFSELPNGAIFLASVVCLGGGGQAFHQKISESTAVPALEMSEGKPVFHDEDVEPFDPEEPVLWPVMFLVAN